jgi:hypothetical protein
VFSGIYCMVPQKKQPTRVPLTIERNALDYIIEPTLNKTLVVKKTNVPVYVIDNTDVIYYDDKRKDVINKFNREIKQRDCGDFETHLRPVVQELIQEPLEDYILNELIGNNLMDEYQVLGALGGVPRPGPDTQSVHDTEVQGTLKTVYDNIKEVSNEANRVFSVRDVLLLAQDLGVDVSKVSRVIDTIKKRSSTVMNYAGDQELKVLQSTWKAGNDNVREQIVRNLVDCVEESPLGTNVVCPTGVTSRIVESALIERPELMPRTRETLVQEMLSKANAVRTLLESNNTYCNLSDTDQSGTLKNALLETYNQDYQGILSVEQVDEYVKDWIDEI